MHVETAVEKWVEEHLRAEDKVTDSTISLEGVMTISKVEALHHQLEDAIGLGGSISFKAMSCERVDTAVLQLLACFVREAQKKELTVSWDEPSENFLKGASLLGVTDYLQLQAA